MKINSLLIYSVVTAFTVFSACKKDSREGGSANNGNFADTTGSLKGLKDFPIGFSVVASDIANAKAWGVVKANANAITFGNELKNSSIVKADGTYDFTAADNMLTLATNAGLEVFGHTLVWHSQQRASYYNSLIGGGSGGSSGAPNLVVNGGFETAATNGDVAEGWQALNGGTQFAITTSNVNSGGKALQANVPAGGQNFNTQIITRTPIAVTAGKTYTISYFIKGASAQNVQFEVRSSTGAVDYQGGRPVTTNYTKITYTYVAPAGATTLQLAFDLGGTANTIYIDDVSIVDANFVAPGSNLVLNPGFENAATNGDIADGWQALNGASQFSVTTSNANSGSKALQAVVPAGGQNFNTQIITRTPIPVTGGATYTISYFIKGASAQNIQFEVRASTGAVDYQGGRPVTTSYAKVSYNYTVPAAATTIQLAFDLGGTANTIYIDDVSITDASVAPPPNNAQLAVIVDGAMKKHIETVLNKYKGKIKAWDVINEPFTDGGGDLRNNTNTPAGSRTDVFVWQHYLGRDYAAKAFQYARAADPAADLYMNDFNLEIDNAKLDAFVALANELKAANTGITGVGTQMHMFVSDSYSGIINMMKKLASTGLKVRISEFDVRINPGKNNPSIGYVPTAYDLQLQAAMYKFVVATYIKYVPPAQRGGITIWGIDDTASWFNSPTNVSQNKLEYPLLFDKNFAKKPAFSGVRQALQGNGEN